MWVPDCCDYLAMIVNCAHTQDFFSPGECKAYTKFIDTLPLELTPPKKRGEAERVNRQSPIELQRCLTVLCLPMQKGSLSRLWTSPKSCMNGCLPIFHRFLTQRLQNVLPLQMFHESRTRATQTFECTSTSPHSTSGW